MHTYTIRSISLSLLCVLTFIQVSSQNTFYKLIHDSTFYTAVNTQLTSYNNGQPYMVADKDGGFGITVSAFPTTNNPNFGMVRTDDNLNPLWYVLIPNSVPYKEAPAIIGYDADSNYIVAGNITYTTLIYQNLFMARVTRQGVIRSSSFPASPNANTYRPIAPPVNLADHRTVFMYYFSNPTGFVQSNTLSQIDTSSSAWQSVGISKASNVYASRIHLIDSLNLMLVGVKYGNAPPVNNYSSYIAVQQYNIVSNTMSTVKTFYNPHNNTSGNEFTNVNTSVKLPGTMGYVIPANYDYGRTSSTSVKGGLWMIRLKANGDTMYSRNFVDRQYVNTVGIVYNSDATITIVGAVDTSSTQNHFEKDVFFMNMDTLFNINWQHIYTYPESQFTSAFCKTADGSLMVGGRNFTLTGGPDKMFFLKADSNGCMHANVAFTYSQTSQTQFSFSGQVSFPPLSGSVNTFHWEFGDGDTSLVQNPTHTFTSSGTFTVLLIASNSCSVDTARQVITICISPQAAFTISTNQQGIYNFTSGTYFPPPNSSNTLQWNFGDGDTSSVANPTHTYSSSGTFTVTLIASNGCTSDTTMQILNVCLHPQASFTSTMGSPGIFDFTSTCVFPPPANISNTLHWNFGDGDTTSVANPTHIYLASGTYTVTLVAANGCFADTITAIINICLQPQTGFTFSSDTSGALSFLSTTFFPLPVSSYNILNWNFGDGDTSSLSNPIHAYATSGQYTVTLIASNTCSNDTLIQIINVCLKANASFSFISNQLGIATFTSIIYFPDSMYVNNSIIWDFGDGDTSSVANPIHNYSTSGIYNVQLIISDSCGTDTVSQLINVVINPLGIQNYLAGSFSLFPNPTGDVWNIDARVILSSITNWRMYDIYGKLIRSGKIELGEFSISANDLPTGIYLIELTNSAGERIAVERATKN